MQQNLLDLQQENDELMQKQNEFQMKSQMQEKLANLVMHTYQQMDQNSSYSKRWMTQNFVSF